MIQSIIKYGISKLSEWARAETSNVIAEALAQGTADAFARLGIEVTAQIQVRDVPVGSAPEFQALPTTSLPRIEPSPPATAERAAAAPAVKKRGRPRKFSNYHDHH